MVKDSALAEKGRKILHHLFLQKQKVVFVFAFFNWFYTSLY